MDILERYVAIDNKCAWPNLTHMPDGSIIATVFGEPCHQEWEGAAECWRSQDGGRSWSFLSVPVPNEKGSNRGNAAVGLAHGGAIVVVCSGRGNVSPKGVWRSNPDDLEGRYVLPPIISRSEDGGTTWVRESQVFAPQTSNVKPFGDIVRLQEGRLALSCYSATDEYAVNESGDSAWIYFSDDEGRTWGDARLIGDGCNETALLVLGEGKMLAASRTNITAGTTIFASSDGGQSWTCRGSVTPNRHMPAHLLQLQDESILLTYGVRLRGMLGVYASISRDDGITWDAPRVLFNTDAYQSDTSSRGTDGGYPASVQSADGAILTAYYCQHIPMHQRYHMGVVLWRD